MCGIFGFTGEMANPSEKLKIMGNALLHRGPDGEGYFMDKSINMGMKRLSILDIENGNQPFMSDDKSIVVICNGEIYNYLSLKKDLINNGYVFNTNNDVEVIPNLYKEYGIDFIKKMNGMYAIALYDLNTSALYLIRDRLGIKPLYYTINNNNIVFSSELKPLIHSGLIDIEINLESFNAFLDLNYIPHPHTPLKNVFKLEQGSYLKLNKNSYKIEKYWNPILVNSDKNENEYFEKFRYLIEDSIKLQLQSDVPVGSFLSGGIDSSYITALAAKYTDKEFYVFNMQFSNTDRQKNETKNAKILAESLNVKPVFKKIEEIDFLEILPRLIYSLEEPFADPAFIPTYYLSELASKNIKVIFSGAGGDEIFGGYSRYKKQSKFKSFVKTVYYNKSTITSYYDIMKTKNQKFIKNLFPNFQKDFFKNEYDKIYHKYKKDDLFNSMMLNDIVYYLQDDILFLNDRMTMSNSIECRVPLLDHRIVELSLNVPSRLKIYNDQNKYLLKKLSSGLIPQNIIDSQKQGFEVSVSDFIVKNKHLYFDPLIEYGYLLKYSLINKNELYPFLLKEKLSSSEIWIYWKIIILEIWIRLFIENQEMDSIFLGKNHFFNNG